MPGTSYREYPVLPAQPTSGPDAQGPSRNGSTAPRNARGFSMHGAWPQSAMTTSLAPAIRAAKSLPSSMGTSLSSAPHTTSVGTVMAPSLSSTASAWVAGFELNERMVHASPLPMLRANSALNASSVLQAAPWKTPSSRALDEASELTPPPSETFFASLRCPAASARTSRDGFGSANEGPAGAAGPRDWIAYWAAIHPPSDSPTSENSPGFRSLRNSPRKSTQVWIP